MSLTAGTYLPPVQASYGILFVLMFVEGLLLLANPAATVPKSLLFLLAGCYFGAAISRTNSVMGDVAIGFVAAAIVIAVASITRRQSETDEP